MKYNPQVKDVLLKLEELGWTEIIDSRWESKVKEDIYNNFPDIDSETVKHILNLVLI